MKTSRNNIAIVPNEPIVMTKEPNTDIRFGISTPFRENDKGELLSIHPGAPFSEAIEQVCRIWGFLDSTIFALKFSEPPGHYVTNATRENMQGQVVSMVHSPSKVCNDILEKLKNEPTILPGLKELSEKAADPSIADLFINKDGMSVLVDIIETEKVHSQEQALAYAFQALLDITSSSNIISWDYLEPKLLSKIAGYVNSPNRPSNERLALKSALELLESVVSAGVGYTQIEKELTLPILVTHVSNPDTFVQQNALALVNALLTKADTSKRKHLATTLASKKYRNIVLNNVINKPGDRTFETSHQLYVLQTLLLNLSDDRKNTPIDPQDPEALNRIKDLCKIAFDSDFSVFASGNLPNFTREYRKLGFQNEVNPALDFVETPPGILALDCMHHLANTHSDMYNKLVVECAYRGAGEEFILPFARASISLTNVICDILKVGEAPGDQGKFYHFFFQHERPFEELFCVCAQLVTKTWKEMRATTEDFHKVFDVIREQIRRALDKMPETLIKFQEHLNKLTYVEIQNLRAQERSSREEDELQAKPIQELKTKVMPEIKSLIKQHRINYMIVGTRFFSKVSSKHTATGTLKKSKEKYWYCRLSPNEKVLHYGDCEDKACPTPEELANKVSVLDLQELLTGKDCPHIDKKTRNVHLAFSLVMEKDPLQTVDFIAPDDKTYALWTDGINALLGKPMTSPEAENDFKIIEHMEIKLRLLDIEGILIPQETSPIPLPPLNFNFSVSPK